MTEADVAKLMSDLSSLASALNVESDAVNAILNRFARSLQSLNIGLEAWATITHEERAVQIDDESEPGEVKEVPGAADTQLGWVKVYSTWQLGFRELLYRETGKNTLGETQYQEVGRSLPQALEFAPRDVRIEALEHLPRLMQELKEKAEAAVAKIQRAKKLVK